MTITLYSLSRDDIRDKLVDFIETYSDLNGHFAETDVTKGSLLTIYTGYQLLIHPKLVDSCSHMTLMHEKTLLIQPNFSSKK